MDLEKKTSHVGRRHKLFVSTKKGVGIYVGNDMTMEDGKMVEIPTGEDAIDNMEGQHYKGKLSETTEMRWRMDQYKGVRMHKAKGKHTSRTQKVGGHTGTYEQRRSQDNMWPDPRSLSVAGTLIAPENTAQSCGKPGN